ncbi:hypothetical protein AZI86_10635 [Bdellovibrio bacteriovorus]|uniref:Uncharacterized protein n=1 Tax=Bdellovibrio bacteriovorus TaxID=959 RepID=A0A150WL89_BDEBC|nr:hypothetical protein [Bdellovibrio bacteriovorus]KYG64662.1 hypothetical protein AZI86_10635 [Bdellovibrio bacteriovorus]
MPNQSMISQKDSDNNIHAKIEFCEDELLDVVRFIGFLRASRSMDEIPEHFGLLYDDELSIEDNIEVARERVYDLRRKLDSLKRIARME